MFTIRGKVIRGKNRGKILGFPTANVALHKNIPEGIYSSEVTLSGKTHQSCTFIGPAITFGEKDYKAESHILDFNEDIYGKWITIRLFKKQRLNKKFASKEALIEQIKQDVLETREFFKSVQKLPRRANLHLSIKIPV